MKCLAIFSNLHNVLMDLLTNRNKNKDAIERPDYKSTYSVQFWEFLVIWNGFAEVTGPSPST